MSTTCICGASSTYVMVYYHFSDDLRSFLLYAYQIKKRIQNIKNKNNLDLVGILDGNSSNTEEKFKRVVTMFAQMVWNPCKKFKLGSEPSVGLLGTMLFKIAVIRVPVGLFQAVMV